MDEEEIYFYMYSCKDKNRLLYVIDNYEKYNKTLILSPVVLYAAVLARRSNIVDHLLTNLVNMVFTHYI